MISVEFVKLQTCFAEVRETLLKSNHDKTRTKPLVFWALPGDRHLPAIFLNRSVERPAGHSLRAAGRYAGRRRKEDPLSVVPVVPGRRVRSARDG